MGTTFHGPNPWPRITRAIRTKGPRHAAIAYLDQDARTTLLPLRNGDVLVVNASKAALRAHATSPATLTHYVDVRVLSSPNLHANVIATNRRAVIGSANASHTPPPWTGGRHHRHPDIVATVHRFIDEIDEDEIGEISEVDTTFIDIATKEWALGRAVLIPGVTGRVHVEGYFLPSPVTNVPVAHRRIRAPRRRATRTAQRRRRRITTGPTTRYQLEWFRLDEPGKLKRDDVLILATHDDE
ncbi:hypothetical protein [Rhodococcus jostii]|uniref:hypothetical protein n=1 Tax=Rhodococcus jostii TaxID=132919 RepID=UPI000A53614E|nr:hypothetical protein [Rhodococcus jostii]